MIAQLPTSQPWYLIGLPGSGKSKVGRILGATLRVPHIDIDAEIERTSGKTISEIFSGEGEAAFRQQEAKAILATAGQPGVFSLGGGCVETPEVRDFLRGQTVIWIEAHHRELLARVSRNTRRPLLVDNPEQKLLDLTERRSPLYREVATCTAQSTSGPPDEVVRQILRQLLEWDFVSVRGTHRYNVITGSGVSELLAGYIPADATKALLVVPDALANQASHIESILRGAGLEVHVFAHRDGETAKNLETLSRAWDMLGKARIGRRDLVVTFGGGVSTDLGGFVAATWLRGIPVIHLPTTLLAMVDASIGGKTGIDTPAGKNLVGAFYDPLAVLVDLDSLVTLPQSEYTAGLAEVIKTGLIEDPEILRIIEDNPRIGDVAWAASEGMDTVAEIVQRSIAVKARIVSADRLEGGLRETLNYGHTMGHAIERAENYGMRHGEAVAIGCIFAAHLGVELGLINAETAHKHELLFESVGLPTRYRGNLSVLMEGLATDKKARQGKLRFVLLSAGTHPAVQEVTNDTVVRVATLLEMEER